MDNFTTPSELNPQQRDAYELAKQGSNVFITGGPGTGKSHLLKHIIKDRKAAFPGGVLVVAPTGVAAQPLGGQTMHSNPGPGMTGDTTSKFENMWSKRKNSQVWQEVHVLVIDEISMVSGEFLDWYMASAERARDGNEGAPLQVILCGDFSQLPPIKSEGYSLGEGQRLRGMQSYLQKGEGEKEHIVPFGYRQCSGCYAFQTFIWAQLNLQTVRLRVVHRASDVLLLNALAEIRVGRGDGDAVRALLAYTEREVPVIDGVEPTVLYSTRADVSYMNTSKLNDLDESTRRVYVAADSVIADPNARSGSANRLRDDSFFKDGCRAPAALELRKGCQVMMVRNEPDSVKDSEGNPRKSVERLVNGSRGVVIGFEETNSGTFPTVQFANGRVECIGRYEFTKEVHRQGSCVRVQVPLILAWAITIHKSQGMSIDRLVVDMKGTFAAGQSYVAISRATGVEGLQIINFKPIHVITDQLALDMNEAIVGGCVDEFVRGVKTWWAPIFDPGNEGWIPLYMRSSEFRKWEDTYPQRAQTKGIKRDRE